NGSRASAFQCGHGFEVSCTRWPPTISARTAACRMASSTGTKSLLSCPSTARVEPTTAPSSGRCCVMRPGKTSTSEVPNQLRCRRGQGDRRGGGRLCVDEHPQPQLELNQRPDLVGVVARTAFML